jgi:hypothetical protein
MTAGTIQGNLHNHIHLTGRFFYLFFMYFIQQCFICRPLDSTVSEDAGIEPRTAATFALACRHSNNSARSHPHSARYHPHLARSHPHSARSHPHSARSHPQTRLGLIHTSAHTDRMMFKNVTEDGSPTINVLISTHYMQKLILG